LGAASWAPPSSPPLFRSAFLGAAFLGAAFFTAAFFGRLSWEPPSSRPPSSLLLLHRRLLDAAFFTAAFARLSSPRALGPLLVSQPERLIPRSLLALLRFSPSSCVLILCGSPVWCTGSAVERTGDAWRAQRARGISSSSSSSRLVRRLFVVESSNLLHRLPWLRHRALEVFHLVFFFWSEFHASNIFQASCSGTVIPRITGFSHCKRLALPQIGLFIRARTKCSLFGRNVREGMFRTKLGSLTRGAGSCDVPQQWRLGMQARLGHDGAPRSEAHARMARDREDRSEACWMSAMVTGCFEARA